MDSETIATILYILGGGITVVMILAAFQLFAIRRNLDELVRQGRKRDGEETALSAVLGPKPIFKTEIRHGIF